MRRTALAALALLLAATSAAFKEADFKKCGDSAFCKRNRGAPGGQFAVQPASVRISSHELAADVVDAASGANFTLRLTAYADTLRLVLDEPGAARVHVPEGVLLPGLTPAPLEGAALGAAECTFSLGAASVTLTFSPLRLDVSVGGEPALSFNGEGGLLIEHRCEGVKGRE